MKAKQWNFLVIGSTAIILILLMCSTIIVDPFLHYHGPLPFLEYPLKDEHYQNDGIARHYKYDSVITGTSMSLNFRCSEFDALWNTESVKIAYSGATFHELGESINRAFIYQENIKYVVCSLDGNRINVPAEKDEYTEYPLYLFDDNVFNDVNYLLNKDVVPKTLAVINYTRAGEVTPNRDMYGNWSQYATFGAETVLKDFVPLPISDTKKNLSETDKKTIKENITKNFLNIALAHPETEFYFFIPPYSICFWESAVRSNQIDIQLETQKLAAEVLLSAGNVHVFDFSDRIDIVGDLNNYTDTLHYSDQINSEILKCMKSGEQELKKENLETYYDGVLLQYMGYDFNQYK